MEGQGILASLLSRYEGIWKVFIQPKRKIYPRDALGPNKRRIDMDTYFQREDNEFYNRRREKIVYTYFAHTSLGQEPQSNESSFGNFFSNFTSFTNFSGTGKRRICMVYLHSHGGSRLESLFLIPYCGSLGIDLCALDFSGSGMSEGEYTTLGINESDDLEDLLQLLIAQKKCSFILWGRSMGAVAAMIHQDKYSQSSQAKVEYIVLDSPFSSVERLVRDVSEAYVTFGEYISMMFYSSIVEVIKGKIGYDFNNLIPLDLCPRLTTPVMFFVGKSDDIVLPIRVKEMHKLYAGPKSFIIVKGNHESARQQHHIEKMITKISKLLNLEKVSSLAQSTNTSEELSDVQNPIMKKLIDLNINLPEFTNTKKAQFTISKNIELSNSRIGLENQYHETQTNLDEANGLLESDVHTKYMKYKTNAVGRANKDFSNFRPPEILGNNHLTRSNLLCLIISSCTAIYSKVNDKPCPK